MLSPFTSCLCSLQATPTITATSFSGGALATGSVLTVTVTKFLATAAGVGAGPGGSTLSAAQLNTITLVGHSGLALTSNTTIDCLVTTATATQLQCVVPPLVTGGYTVQVVVGLGRGLAVNHAASGRRLSTHDDDSANSFVPPPLCCVVPSTPTNTVFTPTSGSRAGGTMLTVTGKGDTTILGILHVFAFFYSKMIPPYLLLLLFLNICRVFEHVIQRQHHNQQRHHWQPPLYRHKCFPCEYDLHHSPQCRHYHHHCSTSGRAHRR